MWVMQGLTGGLRWALHAGSAAGHAPQWCSQVVVSTPAPLWLPTQARFSARMQQAEQEYDEAVRTVEAGVQVSWAHSGTARVASLLPQLAACTGAGVVLPC